MCVHVFIYQTQKNLFADPSEVIERNTAPIQQNPR